jgi:hypothetical protein
VVLGTETEPRILVRDLLFDNEYLSEIVDDKKPWFTQMDMLD